ncbi:hypothetical protein [Chromobacterium sphagni]|uniref:Uncharacterized protein n=1 Tax=Chromobacterium sphagni TaxID=1903179 RepID=A0A1S1X4I0_9NEIS|nr:hypothetical protein [Chromobacterium sphagni]OHX14387.1 hypothetical protein BI347_13405 [Chromobacterium sphagni]OHX20776.1 hypothetical protein BI344_14135 [Chromobacterium sphagni]
MTTLIEQQAATGQGGVHSSASGHPLSASCRIAAIYPGREEADDIRRQLIADGIAASQVDIVHSPPPAGVAGPDHQAIRSMLAAHVGDTMLGSGAGIAGTIVLWAPDLALFVTSQAVAPLAALGWFSSLGGLLRAVTGAESNAPLNGPQRAQGRFSELMMDAVRTGDAVLIVQTRGIAEREWVKKRIGESLSASAPAAGESAARNPPR